MALKTYECPFCGRTKKSFKVPECDHDSYDLPPSEMKVVLTAPQAKFMEPRDGEGKARGKSFVKGYDQIVKARARAHSRDTLMDDMIQKSDSKEMAKGAGWLTRDGKKRSRLDDK